MKHPSTLESQSPAMTTALVSVIIVSSNEIVRNGLAAMIADWSGFRVVDEERSLNDLPETTEGRSERAVIVHERFPSNRFTKELRNLLVGAPGLRVIALFDDCDRIGLAPMLRMDVAGILRTDIGAAGLRSAFERICDGRRVFSAEVKRSLQEKTFRPELSGREVDTVQRLVEGMSNQSIADSLDISAETVKHHIRSLLRKLNASNRTQAAIKAVQYGIARCPSVEEGAARFDHSNKATGLIVI